MNEAEVIFQFARIWASIGAVIAVIFLTVGIDRIDEDARGAYVFRLLLFPAFLIIWPIILWRWFALENGRDPWRTKHQPPRRAHTWIAIIFALAIPAILLTGWSIRQVWPENFQPQKISAVTGQIQ